MIGRAQAGPAQAKLTLIFPHSRGAAQVALSQQYALLPLHRLGPELRAAGHAAQPSQGETQRGVIGFGEVELVVGVEQVGHGVLVTAKRHARRLEAADVVVPQISRFEDHVLDEMRSAPLARLLEEGSGADHQAQRCAS